MTQKMGTESGSSISSDKKQGMPPPQDAAAGNLKEGLLDGARTIGAEVQHLAGDVAGGAKKSAESKVVAGKDFAAEQLGTVADALRKTSKELRASDSGATDYVDMAASSVEKISNYLQTRTLSQLIGDVEGYARREPAMFLGGAFLAGVLGGRFLKSAKPVAPAPATRAASASSPRRALPQHASQGGTQPASKPFGDNDRVSKPDPSTPAQAQFGAKRSPSTGPATTSSGSPSIATSSASSGGARPSTTNMDGNGKDVNRSKGTGVS
jgi:hypothetical protein